MANQRISQDQLKRNFSKPLSEYDLLSKAQFDQVYPADLFEIFSIFGLNKARTAIFELCKGNPEKQSVILEKAKTDFSTLKKVNVILTDENGVNVETSLFVRPKSTLEKAMKSEELGLSKDEASDDEEKGSKKPEGKDTKKAPRFKKKGSTDDDKDPDKDGDDDSKSDYKHNPDADEDEKSTEDDEDENEDENEDEDEDEENDDDQDLDDDALEVLSFIKEALDEDGEVEEKEISDEEGLSDEETNKIIELLVKKGFIEVEEDEQGRGYNITGITEEGIAAIGDDDSEDGDGDKAPEENDVQSDKVVMDKKEFMDEHEKLIDKLNKTGNKEGADAQKKELDGVKKEDAQENGAADGAANDAGDGDAEAGTQSAHAPSDEEKQQAGQQGGDPAQLAAFAKQTPTDKLEEYVKDASNPPANIQVAQAELDRRKQEGDAGPSADGQAAGQPGQEDDETPEQKAEKQEFDGWVDDYLENHDIEDLQELVKGLILASPGETKVLKDHYRNEYKGNNKGNTALKVDKKEFEEWIIQYLQHYPQAHLKKYAMELASKDPDALGKLKGKFKALKDNKIM